MVQHSDGEIGLGEKLVLWKKNSIRHFYSEKLKRNCSVSFIFIDFIVWTLTKLEKKVSKSAPEENEISVTFC